MSLSEESFCATMDGFMTHMIQGKSVESEEVKTQLLSLSEAMGVARLEYSSTITVSDNTVTENKVIVDNKDYDKQRAFKKEEEMGTGKKALFAAYPYKSQPDWNQAQLRRINLISAVICLSENLKAAKETENELLCYDPVLDMKNLTFLRKKMEEVVSSKRQHLYDAVFFNLRSFNSVNRMVGFAKGTEIMKRYIKMIEEKFDSDEWICHVGGDNFAAFFKKNNEKYVKTCLEGVALNLDDEAKERVLVGARAGYCDDLTACKSSVDIMEKIAVSCNIARNAKLPIVYFDEQLDRRLAQQANVENMFPDAVDKNEFTAYYQPKVLLDSNTLCGAEALCRWVHDGKHLPPASFIPIFEKSNLICDLDFYMLEAVCRDIRRWIDSGKEVVRISVNISRRHLANIDLLDKIVAIIDKYNVPHEYIEIEITETATDVNFDVLKDLVRGLNEKGIVASVDDFGAGFSSVNLVKDIPWNSVKLDKSFLPSGKFDDDINFVILRHIVALFQDMGVKCVAEGLETSNQILMLKGMGCHYAQGYYFDRPLPVIDFEKRLDDKQYNLPD